MLTNAPSAESTPLLRQYWEIKNQHQDAILFFRLGDFYEMFFDDARVASQILDITLTSRDKSAESPIPLCGVPYHSASNYISRLLDRGHKVAICEQVEDPKAAKGLVKREVTRVITPGLRTELEGLSSTESSTIASVYASGSRFSLASLDISSGALHVSFFESEDEIAEELTRIAPPEIVLMEKLLLPRIGAWIENEAPPSLRVERVPAWVADGAAEAMSARFGVAGLEGFGIQEPNLAAPALASLLHYVEKVNRTPLPHLTPPQPYSPANFVQMDSATRNHLELFPSRGDLDRGGSLQGILDETRTSMGGRRLKEWIHFPLRELKQIGDRQDAVEELLNDSELRESLRSELGRIYDIERLTGRIASGRANARDLVSLRSTLVVVQQILETSRRGRALLLKNFSQEVDPHKGLLSRMESAIHDDPPHSLNEGGLIRDGFDPTLDELRKTQSGGRAWIAELEAAERKRTGISSLKIRYNRVFGYFIEITKANLERVPADYERKQTLAGAERYVTSALKEQEAILLGAEEKVDALEAEIFEALRKEVAAQATTLGRLADGLANLDVLCSLARIAASYGYVRPTLVDGDILKIRGGRHPVVERGVTGNPFVPNDILLDTRERQILILTGPNMAGKSTIMRQVALIVILAQIGSFVPAEEAEIGIVDRIFTRVGASDDLSRGRSTFMVEMNETANILRNATSASLVLLDEIGRGTSTFDGLSIAWSVAEDLHDRIGAKTIFATHYHELTDLPRTKARAFNMNVTVRELGDRIVFLHTLTDGPANRSYGIDVARLAGVPENVIARARVILENLERGELDALGQPSLAREALRSDSAQLDLFRRLADELYQEMAQLSPDLLTPRQALDLIYAWCNRYRGRGPV